MENFKNKIHWKCEKNSEEWIVVSDFSVVGQSVCVCRFTISAPSHDAKPGVQLPDRSGRAADSQPRSHWQPAKQYGQPDARHDGPVPSNAVLSGTWLINFPSFSFMSQDRIWRGHPSKSVLTLKQWRWIWFVLFCCLCSRFLFRSRRTSSQCLCPASRDRGRWLCLACSPATACSPPTSTPPWGITNKNTRRSMI